MDILQRNLEALLSVDPLLTAKIFELRENNSFEVYVDSDPANINIISKNDLTPIYCGKPIEETELAYKDCINYQRYPYLYFFGLGNGILYKMLLQNPVHQRLVIFEPELEIIYIVLNMIDFSQEIMERRFRVELSEDMTFDRMVNVIFSGTAKLYAKVYNLLIPFGFYEKYFDDISRINTLVVDSLKHLAYAIGNDVVDSLIGVEHHIRNLPRMIHGPTLYEAVKKGKNSSIAVIVSTGPSLAKQLPLLKKYQQHITILSLDASFPILVAHKIKPDMVFSIERVSATASFYKKTPKSAFKGVNFMISSIAHQELIENIVGGTLQLSMRPFGYLTGFEHHEWGYIGSGMSAANMAFEFAALSGFDKIVLIGQDLAYAKDGLSHAKGHIFGDDEVKQKESDLYTTAYGGDGEVRTTLVWQMFKNYFEISIAQMNDAGRFIAYNATEGGARIEGAIEIPFETFLSEFVDTTFKKARIKLNTPNDEICNKAIGLTISTIKDFFEHGERVKSECEKVFLETVEELEKIEKLKNEEKLDEIDFDLLLGLNKKIDAIKELFEDERFDKLFGTVMMPLMLHQEIELATIMVRNVEDDLERKIKLIDWIYAHKFWLFSMAGSIQSTLIRVSKGVLMWENEDKFKEIIEMSKKYVS
ncbi:MAG: DUF115 domain-containing protein [Sulfuricurvum sp.]|uniref:motility associated factor glycosyltransferase family protein n=1 Tax=Sulfuricurvum sp. TaxID=2025608 RepID=UPI00261DDB9A|nr:6-hydroxymethylpterin diphosphokinase MptE-like protein [Sulfuricurvum sp.]MDD2830182.1 DUF115 domain-containing protein [Sulfuricurvum sp.]MDD4949246.1 DUF115 domain-containing protein [Sulfuricurvum sp.]